MIKKAGSFLLAAVVSVSMLGIPGSAVLADDTNANDKTVTEAAVAAGQGAAYDAGEYALSAATKTKISSVKLQYTSKQYTGKALKPSVTVKAKIGGKTKTLKKGTDYTVSYKNNKNVGTATVTVKGKGNYTGTITKKFKITAVPVSAVTLEYSETTYTGKALKPAVTVKAKVDGSTKNLKKSTDYTVTYKNNKNVGTATVTVKGKGNFKGTKTASFQITPAQIESVQPGFERMLYTGYPMTQKCSEVRATLGGKSTVLTEGKDYTISFSNNVEVGDDARIHVEGMGNFTGTLDAGFTICKVDFIDPVNDWDLYDGLISQVYTETDQETIIALMHIAEDVLMSTYRAAPLYYYVDDGYAYGTYYMMFNPNSGLFADRIPQEAAYIRRAITILTDRTRYAEFGPAANTFVPIGMPDGNGGIFHKSLDEGWYDVAGVNAEGVADEARDLLVKAGFRFDEDGKLSADTPLTFEYLFNDEGVHATIAAGIKEDLGQLGIDMELKGVSREEWNEAINSGDYTAIRAGWAVDDEYMFDPAFGMLTAFWSYYPE